MSDALPKIDRLLKLTDENMDLRRACRAARRDLEAIIPVVESALDGVPASSLRNTLGLLNKALQVAA